MMRRTARQREAHDSAKVPLAVRLSRMMSVRASSTGSHTVYLSAREVADFLAAHEMAVSDDALLAVDLPRRGIRVVRVEEELLEELERLDALGEEED